MGRPRGSDKHDKMPSMPVAYTLARAQTRRWPPLFYLSRGLGARLLLFVLRAVANAKKHVNGFGSAAGFP